MINSISPLYTLSFEIPWCEDGNDLMRCGGIYIIENISTDKLYIGSSKYFHRRYQRHRRPLINGIHKNKHLQNSFTKHGKENFKFHIVEFVVNHDNLIDREQFWLDLLMPYKADIGYNIADIAGPTMNTGISPSIETRNKISKTLILKGYTSPRKNVKLSQETKDKISKNVRLLCLKGSKLPQSRKIEIFNVLTSELEVFETLTAVRLKYHIYPSTLNKYNNSDKLLKGIYKIKILNDYAVR
jgi:group I intron endonuclease